MKRTIHDILVCSALAACAAPEPSTAPAAPPPPDPDALLIEVESAEGRPIEGALVTSYNGVVEHTDATGGVWLPSSVVGHGISVSAVGFRYASVRPPVEAQTVTLARCPWVTLVLAKDVELPTPPLFLSVALGEPTPEGGWGQGRTAGIDAWGEVHDIVFDFSTARRVEIAVPAGSHDVVWGLTRRDPDGSLRAHSAFGLDRMRRIEVPSEGEPSTFEVRPPQDDLELVLSSFDEAFSQ